MPLRHEPARRDGRRWRAGPRWRASRRRRCSRRPGPRLSAWVASTRAVRNSSYTDSSTSTRSTWMHICPVFAKAAAASPRPPSEVGVLADDQWVLAAELERGADQPASGLLADGAPGAGRAGEADVVDRVDQGGADDAAATRDDVPRVGGQPGLGHQGPRVQQGECGLGVGLRDHGVAREQRGDDVADAEVERVVPRRDHADDSLGDAGLLDLGQAGDRAADRGGGEVLLARRGRSGGRA